MPRRCTEPTMPTSEHTMIAMQRSNRFSTMGLS